MFLAAARLLAESASVTDLAVGSLFPPLSRIREISTAIATGVAEIAYERGLASGPRPRDIRAAVEALMYRPSY
jgi:malate dehydrogenase (oxaloacetate-decarboxylating)(NADP+)